MQATTNSGIKCKITCLLFIEVLIVAKVVTKIPSPKILHGQVEMFPILKGLDGVDDKLAGHLIQQDFLVYHWIHTLFYYNSKAIIKLVPCFGHLFHSIRLLCLLLFYLPDTPEPPWTYLVNKIIRVSCYFYFPFLKHHRRMYSRTFLKHHRCMCRGIFLCPKQPHIKILFDNFLWGFHFNHCWVFFNQRWAGFIHCRVCWCIQPRFNLFRKFISFLSRVKKVLFLRVNILIKL